VVHIRGRNGKKGASHGNNNVEGRDENDTTNLPESIHICPCSMSGDVSAKLCVGLEK
jgi:hypothetical protein